jgi:pimeloyl-ACP methyl ester carboxylesterase
MRYFLILILISNQSFCQKPVERSDTIEIGGIKQYIRIKGKDISNPILLFLHGGPGSSLMGKADKFTDRLQEHFVVVQWDQRETGETLKLNKSSRPLTVKLFFDDTHDLIDTLLTQFHRPKLYLAGYSWGTVLGFHIADKYPELLYAYIAISPVINNWKSEQLALDMLKEKMGNKANKELSQVKVPFENVEQLYYHRKWLFKYSGQKLVSISFRKGFVRAWGTTWFKVWTEACSENLFESLPTIDCPVYFFAGEKDYQTNHTITEEYYDKVLAPKKDLFLFAEAGHGLPETDPGQFQEMIIDKVLPETINR